MIYGPQYNQNIKRVDPIDKDRSDHQDNRQKKKAVYQGRSYSEKEEDLPVQPKEPPPAKEKGVYVDLILLQKAKKFLSQLTTLEEKCAQLCFLGIDALYDKELQLALELILQVFQVGGVVFKKGDYKRQTYLITRFQEISKTPLLIGNEFHHGLSFYFQGDVLKNELSEQHFRDLGKAVTVQNRRMGVHIQFDQEKGSFLSEKQAKAFRKGVREAQGIVGKQCTEKALSFKTILPFRKDVMPLLSEPPIPETGYKVLTFFDMSKKSFQEETILEAYRQHYDAFLLSKEKASDMITMLCNLVHSGKISEEDLDKRLLKILVIKALYFK